MKDVYGESTKRTFSFDSEMDADILELIDKTPNRKKSRLARKAFRVFIEMMKKEVKPIRAEGFKLSKRED